MPKTVVFPACVCLTVTVEKINVWLQANYEVSQVVLTNRQECCRCPLAGANIYIGNPSNLNVIAIENPDLSQEAAWELCATVCLLQAVFIICPCMLNPPVHL